MEELQSGRRVLRYDSRGTGMSQRVTAGMHLDVLLADLEAVVDAAGLERFSLLGGVTGGPVAIMYAARHPARIGRLILSNTWARARDAIDDRESQLALAQLCRANWQLASRTIGDLGPRQVGEEGLQMAELIAQSTTGEVAARLFEDNVDFDVSHLLPQIGAPTLVAYPQQNSWPALASQRLASLIPDARLVTIPEGGTLEESYYTTSLARTKFLDEDPETRRIDVDSVTAQTVGAFRTVLFTDLVGHSEMMSRLGDERGRAVLREHEAITRNVLKQHSGTEIKTMGDGFMASFPSVTRGVECAIALQRAFAERNANLPSPAHGRGMSAEGGLGEGEPLHVRVGLNAGEPIEEDGDLFGATVILASRIAARAEAGHVFVSENVRSLCSGKGFRFADRGEFVAKGFEEPVRIYEVNWRPA
jgi:class 3 adenylate cyclase